MSLDASAQQLDGELQYAPGFHQPGNLDYEAYHRFIDESLPPESPYLYGLHPNAEIGFLTATSEVLFRTVLEMQPRDSSSGGGTAASREEKVHTFTCSHFCVSYVFICRDCLYSFFMF